MTKSFQTIINMLPNLMQGLSKHYYKDEHFVPLMEKIANEIINRVRQTIDIRTLLSSYTLNEAKNICYQAKQLLLQWKIEYQNTQSKLENDKQFKYRSSETTLDMLMKFQQIETTHILAYEMIQQFTAILLQYCKEIDGIYDPFMKYKDNPPIFKKKIEIKYLIYYDPNLKESLIACYYSEKLGFNLPESIIQIKLQYSKYEQLSNELRLMLEDYHLTIASFDTIELSFLQSYIDHIQIIIKPGTSRISFGKIDNFDYINECKKTIRQISLDIHEHLETFRFCIIDPIVSRHNDGITHGISQLPKHFVRWLRGTCISCPVIPVLDENLESPDFTFYNDVKQHLDVRSLRKIQMRICWTCVMIYKHSVDSEDRSEFSVVKTMSKHYNKDERFVPFMEKIANEIVNRVRQTINIRTLLSSNTLSEAKNICYQAKQLLLQWKIEYQNTRSKLENDKRNFST
ncbi:unnamed protein product [Rotaria sp. Silwood2]|nr:unnamed protein product [Rotaria sp. Silwood2]